MTVTLNTLRTIWEMSRCFYTK